MSVAQIPFRLFNDGDRIVATTTTYAVWLIDNDKTGEFSVAGARTEDGNRLAAAFFQAEQAAQGAMADVMRALQFAPPGPEREQASKFLEQYTQTGICGSLSMHPDDLTALWQTALRTMGPGNEPGEDAPPKNVRSIVHDDLVTAISSAHEQSREHNTNIVAQDFARDVLRKLSDSVAELVHKSDVVASEIREIGASARSVSGKIEGLSSRVDVLAKEQKELSGEVRELMAFRTQAIDKFDQQQKKTSLWRGVAMGVAVAAAALAEVAVSSKSTIVKILFAVFGAHQ